MDLIGSNKKKPRRSGMMPSHYYFVIISKFILRRPHREVTRCRQKSWGIKTVGLALAEPWSRARLRKGTNSRLEVVRPSVSAGPPSGVSCITDSFGPHVYLWTLQSSLSYNQAYVPGPKFGSKTSLAHQALIALSGTMSNIDQQGSSLGSYPTSPQSPL